MSVGKFLTGAKDILSTVGKFYTDNKEGISNGLRAYGAYRALNQDPEKPPSKKDLLLASYLSSLGGGRDVGATSFFPNGSKVDVEHIEETQPTGNTGTYKFKISGFSSSPFIRLKK